MSIMMAEACPRVSILMLTRNHAPFIGQAIESILSQTFQDWELLIGEDSSTDCTAQIAEQAALSDPRIFVFSSPSIALGFHKNFARLLSFARAPYVAFLEGDDWWSEPRKLELQTSLLDAESDLAFCGGHTRILDQRVSGPVHPSVIGPASHRTRLTFADLVEAYNFHFSSILMRRDFVGLPDWIFKQYCLDRPLYLLAARHGDAGVIDAELSVYRLHDGGVWAPLSPLQKATRSMALFRAFCRHFPSFYRTCFRRTLSHILWSYLGASLCASDRRESLLIFLMAVFAAPRLRFIDSPRLTLGAFARIVCPFGLRA